MNHTLDAIDRKILKVLQDNGRISVTELSERVNLSKTPCAERMKRLERGGYIKGYHALLDPKALDLGYLTYVQVTLEQTTTVILDKFNLAIQRVPEVESCHMMAGGYDYLLKIRTSDMAHYRKVLGDSIGSLPGVSQTHTYPVMETVVEKRGVSPILF